MDINYELYKVFYYVATSLSFSEASKKLFISQSAVSQSIKTLEKKLDQSYVGVTLVTAHSSKGMEWPIVFNSITCYDTKELHTSGWSAIEEKRRLLFVSITRARDELYVTGQYIAFGDKTNRSYNMFLKECYEAIGKEFVPYNPEEAAS